MNQVVSIRPEHDRAELLSTAAAAPSTRDEFVTATDLPRELRVLTGRSCPVSARRLIVLGANDQLPLERMAGPRRWWGAWRRNLPQIAMALGMIEQPAEMAEPVMASVSASPASFRR